MQPAFKEKYVDPVKKHFADLGTKNSGYYVPFSQVVQRCVFFKPNHKAVLLELMSWFDEKGRCEVNQQTICRNTGIRSLKTVDTVLDFLVERKFILKSNKLGFKNVYKSTKWDENPYLLLSEAVYAVEELAKKQYGVNADKITKKMYLLADKEERHKPLIARIIESGFSYEEALQIVCDYANKELKLEMVIPLDDKEEEKKPRRERGSKMRVGIKPKQPKRNRESIPSEGESEAYVKRTGLRLRL
ncbi:helix-turn-helix domain-containing protein [Bacillus paranthracis]|uniref:helix-turn-helix domain-containing protein n=1 Tax=Bacillus paranthracis TaxID=2026186 RepID=UPI0021D0A07D|nr:helix-turn-helix domain-containing protein [Bacillus paranthracis]MCU5474078.1 helix-turn-helix domain-containing protein [Bacillus paranthracis]